MIYRFRVEFEYDPTVLWHDIVVGVDRPLEEFQAVINESMGLDQDHLLFSALAKIQYLTNLSKRVSLG